MTELEQIPPPTDEDAEDPDRPPRPPLTSLERVNAMLGRWYRLQHTVDAYDALHNAELTRLKRRREEAVGPTERRIARLKAAIEQFAVEAYLGFGELGHRVPNGDITSRPVVITIDKDDAVATREWIEGIVERAAARTALSGLEDAYELRPWVDMKKLRAWLDKRVAAGHLQRMVSIPADDPADVEFWLVDEKKGWLLEFEPGMIGVWFWTEEGAEAYMENHGDVLRGVTWAPNGTMGSGRNFKVRL